MEKRSLYRKVLLNTLVIIVVILLCIFLLPKLIRFFLPFVIGWIIAMIANPLVRVMEKKVKIVRRHSSAIIIIGVLAAVVGILYLACSVLIREILQFVSDMPAIYQQVDESFQLFTGKLGGLYKVLPSNAKDMLDNFSASIGDYISGFMTKIDVPSISQAGNWAKNILDGVFIGVITLLSSYFFISDRDRLVGMIRKNTPKFILEKFDIIIDNFKFAVGGYFKAQFKIMFVIWFILFIGFTILSVDYSFLLALVVAFIDLLPFFGTGCVIFPWVIYKLVIGELGYAICLVVLYLVCQLVKQILQPKMVGDSIGISPLTTLFFMFVGYRIGGLFGLIIGIPCGLVIVNLYRSGMFESLVEGYQIMASDIAQYLKMK